LLAPYRSQRRAKKVLMLLMAPKFVSATTNDSEFELT
jgi:hypothetical protein